MKVERLAPYLGSVIALVVMLLIIGFSNGVTVEQPRAPHTPSASSTLSVAPNFELPPLSLPDIQPTPEHADTAATASAPKATATPPKKVAALQPTPAPAVLTPPAPVPATVTVPVQQPSPHAALSAPATALVNALVNIICFAPQGSTLHSISGSGVIIDPKGIILTNAHVAQYFLLADRAVSCVIRTGSPAATAYKASLIYISPDWLRANPTVLTQTEPSGTGEFDFALLAITQSTTSALLPSPFPSVPLAALPPLPGLPVAIASYGAQFLEAVQIRSSLFPVLVYGSIQDVFTFGGNTIDVLALGGSAVAQEGSSGGGVVDASGELVGTITTSTVTGTIATRSLDAITASYIRSEYANETGSAIDLLLSQPTASAIADFAPRLNTLEALLSLP